MAAQGGIEVHVVDDAQSQESITVISDTDDDADADGDVWADVAAPAPEPRRRNKDKRRLANPEDGGGGGGRPEASGRARGSTAGRHRARDGHLAQPLDTVAAGQRRPPRRLGPRTRSVELVEASRSSGAVRPPKGKPGKRRRTQPPSAAADISSIAMGAVGFGVRRDATANGHSRDREASTSVPNHPRNQTNPPRDVGLWL